MTQTRMIEIARIDAGDRLRSLDPAWVDLLAEEIAVDGLIEPIRVAERGDGFKLVAGARRLAAHIKLGWSELEAVVETAEDMADDTAVRLAEIKSHMLRGDLTALDRAVTIAAWCQIHRAGQEPAKPGRKKAAATPSEDADELSANLALNWTEAAQQALQIGRRTIFRSLKIAEIDAELRRQLALHPVAQKQSELLLLAEQSPARQSALVELLTAEPAQAQSVIEAIALYDSAPQARRVPAYERIGAKVAALKPAEQDALFDGLSDQIERWQAKRRTAVSSRKAA